MNHSVSGSSNCNMNGNGHLQPGSFNHHHQLTPASSSTSITSIEQNYPDIMGENTNVRFSTRPRTILGKGATSIVYPGYHTGKNALTAVKWIEDKYLRLDNGNLAIERSILQDCDFVNIIGLYDSYWVKNDGLYLAMERAEMTLYDAITRKSASRDQVIIWCKGTCGAVEYLHTKKMIHRDIKPSNILLVKTEDNNLIAKLADFGLSKKMSGSHLFSGTLTSSKGTFPYMAPETLKMLTQKFVVTKAGDIFSLAVTIYYTVSNGEYPFPANDDIAMKAKILDKKVLPKKLPKEYFADQDLLWKMLDKEPGNRPKISEVVHHSLLWTWERKMDFIMDVAHSLETDEPSVLKSRVKMNNAYKAYYRKISAKKFNWLKLLDKLSHRNILLSRISQPDIEKNYGNYDWISQLIKLYRDNSQHPGDIKTDANGDNPFTVGGRFSKEKYTLYFLQLCPGFVDVVYSEVRDNPLPFTSDYYAMGNGSTLSLCTPASQKKLNGGSIVPKTGTATLLRGSSIRIYEGDLISRNYFRGYSDCFLNPAAVYKTSVAQKQYLESTAEKWKLLASTRPLMNYLAPILSIAKIDKDFYIAVKLAKFTVASKLKLDIANSTVCRNNIIEYLTNVVNGIACLHENMVVHGKIDQDHILLFGERKKVAKLGLFTLYQPNCNEEILKEMRNDLMSFADLMQFSFSSKMQSNGFNTSVHVAAKDYTWDHLVRWIRESSGSPPTIFQVANHPLFWDMRKSFDFISMFWRTLTVNGKVTLDEQYAKFYREREGVEFNWISQIDPQYLLPYLAKNGNNLSGLLCLISLAYKHMTIFRGESAYMEYFNSKFPDIVIVCFCVALSKGYLPECYQNDIRQFLCYGQVKKDEVQMSEWMSIPSVF